VRHLNHLHRTEPGLHQRDFTDDGFQWIDASDTGASVLSWLRHPARDDAGRPVDPGARPVLVVCNFTPVPRSGYHVGVPHQGHWVELGNSDASEFGGSGVGNLGGVDTVGHPAHGHATSLPLTLPPLGVLFLAPGPG
jgi:1,4-alpha-glucan branching enzyme